MAVVEPIDFISRLPNEMLIKIVEICVEEGHRCLDEEEYPLASPQSDPIRSPWILSQVCRHWRNLTLSLPHIWTFINMKRDEGCNGLHSQTTLQLERCQDQPLTVFWHGWSMSDNDNQLALRLTCAKSAQWRKADLSGDLSRFVDFSAYEMTFPELISLRLNLSDDIGGGFQIIPNSLRNARKLHDLTLSGDCEAFRLLSALPWGQITRFTAEYLFEDPDWWDTFDNCTLYDTLPLLRNVQHCSLEVYKELASFEGQPIVLPHLHTLILTPGDGQVDDLIQLLDALTLPALRKLQIECEFLGPHGLCELLDRSGCQLEEFEFDHGCMSPQALATLLSHERLQSIRALKLPGSVDRRWAGLMTEEAAIQAFQYPLPGEETTRSIILPNLVSLTYTRAQFNDEGKANALIDMVSSRRSVDHLPNTVARLQELVIQSKTPFLIQAEVTRSRLENICDGVLIFVEVRDNY
ncbi:hypothetical protein PQX77_012593 [Marasmius sp. AFHP31]|nr:hypothetical protein PQX77_012593 [Marasmius sp. AFHP31]